MMHSTILFSKLKIKDTKRCHFKKHGIGLFNPHACMTFSCFFFLFLQLFLAQLWVSLQEFTVLPTEKFRRCMIRSSSVIFLPMSSPTEYVRRLYLRRWFPIPSVYRSEKQKKPFTDGFTDGTCAPKKKRFPLEIYRRIFIPSVTL